MDTTKFLKEMDNIKNNDRGLSLEDIRLINHLEISDMARTMDVTVKEYEYLKEHTGELDVFKLTMLSYNLNIGIEYIRL